MIQEITTLDEFNQIVATNKMVLLNIYGEYCPACKQVKAYKWLEKLHEEFKELLIVKAKTQDFIKHFEAKYIPYFVMLSNGEKVFSDYYNLEQLRTLLKNMTDSQPLPSQDTSKVLQEWDIRSLYEAATEGIDTENNFSVEINNSHLGWLNEILCREADVETSENLHGFTLYQAAPSTNNERMGVGYLRPTDSTSKYICFVFLSPTLVNDKEFEVGDFLLIDAKSNDFIEAVGTYLVKNLY